MNRYLRGFLAGPSEEEQVNEGAVTRARAAAAAVKAAQQAGLQSPSPNPRNTPQFFPEDMATAGADIEELRRITKTAIQALATATAGQSCPKKPELPAFDKDNVDPPRRMSVQASPPQRRSSRISSRSLK